MLTLQLNEAGLINFNETISSKLIITIDDLDNECDLDNEENDFNSNISIKAEKIEPKIEPIKMKPLNKLQKLSSVQNTPTKPVPSLESLVSRKNSNVKQFKLNEITASKVSEFTSKNLDEMLFKTYDRILNSEGQFIIYQNKLIIKIFK